MANPKIIGSITLAALAVSAFLAFKNMNAYEQEIVAANKAKSNMETNRNLLQDLQDQSNEIDSETRESEQSIASLTEQDDKLKRQNFELKAQEQEKAAEVDEFQGAAGDLQEQEARFAKVTDTVEKLGALSKDIEQLDAAIEESQSTLDVLSAENAELDKDVNALREVLDLRSQGRSLDGLITSIRAIYTDWGFVTLEAGDSEGVVLNSVLDVTRDAQVIGKLLVTAVEKDSSSASIIPDSVVAGNMLAVGDQVVPTHVDEIVKN